MPLDAPALNLLTRTAAATVLLEDVFAWETYGPAAMVTSFGAESAVLLHLLAKVRKDAPVLFVDTQMLFAETLEYQLELSAFLGLTNMQVISADDTELRRQDAFGRLHLNNPDACCDLRKTRPLAKVLEGYDIWVSGRKRHQSATRAALETFEADGARLKLNPLADWSRNDIAAYFALHTLPKHPLLEKGFLSIGCAACTSAVKAGDDPRSGRWRGAEKTECGIHFENGKITRPAA